MPPSLRFFYPRAIIRVVATVQLSRTSDETKTVEFFVVPRSFTLERNDYNQADTLSLTLDVMRFPVLPRNIRQALVELYFGDARSIDSEDDPIVDPSLIRFIGYIDQPELSMSEDDGVITWKARDYTALLIDTRRPLTSTVPLYGDTLDVSLRRILDALPGGSNIGLVPVGFTTWPSLSTGAPGGLTDAKIPVKQDDTAWHLVKRACDAVSLIPQIKLDKLVVSTSRGLRAPRSQAVFVYGANLTEYRESRTLTKLKEGIGLRAYDLSQRQYITSIYPPAGDPETQKKIPKKAAVHPTGTPSTANDPNDKRRWFPYPPVANQAALDAATKRVFDERRFQEFEGGFRCARMLVPDASVDDLSRNYDGDSFDVTSLSSGDRVIVDVLPEQRNVLGGLEGTDRRVGYLVDQGYEQGVAAALVAVHESGLDGPLEVYVRKAAFSMSDGEGFGMSLDFQNLIQGG